MDEVFKGLGIIFSGVIIIFLSLIIWLSIERLGCEDALNVDSCTYTDNGWEESK